MKLIKILIEPYQTTHSKDDRKSKVTSEVNQLDSWYDINLCRESPNFVRCKENPSSSADENVVSD